MTSLNKPDWRWTGVIGTAHGTQKREEKSVEEKNLDTLREKVAYDLYKTWSERVFLVPKTRLALQDKTIVLMVRVIETCQGFDTALTCDQDKEISFFDYLKNYECVPEKLLTPAKKLVPLQGVMELLAVARALGDIDPFNGGFVWVKNLEGEIIAAECVKGSVAQAMNFMRIREAIHQLLDPRHLHGPMNGKRIVWQKLSAEQKRAFISTLLKCCRQKDFSLGEDLSQQLTGWLSLQERIYREDLQRLEPVKENPPVDPETRIYQALMRAKKEKNIEMQVGSLRQLAELYLGKGKFLIAAKIINAALALLPEDHPDESKLITRLEEIEELFLKSKGIHKPLERNHLQKERHFLKTLRRNVEFLFKEQKDAKTLLKEITEQLKTLTAHLVVSAQKCVGSPPTEWVLLGTGSMVRDEMGLGSDVECAFAIKKATPETLRYFHLVTEVFEFNMVNMGQTPFFVFGEKEKSPTPHGFSLDIGGNSPYGDRSTYELIGTPEQLARFQDRSWIDRNIIVANAMGSVCFIAGNRDLFDQYQKEVAKILNSHREFFGLYLLEGDLTEFFPDLSARKEKRDKAFGIKKELYRPFQEMIGALAVYFRLQAKNTLDRVQELVSRGIFSAEGGKNIRNAILRIFSLRIEAQLFYKDGGEFLCYKEETGTESEELLYLDEKRTNELLVIYKALLPFCRCMKEFVTTRDPKVLSRHLFYEEGPAARGMMLDNTMQYTQAREVYQQAVSLDPSDLFSHYTLCEMDREMGHYEEALQRAKKILELAEKKGGERHPDLALAYQTVGLCLSGLERHEEALKNKLKSLEIGSLYFEEFHWWTCNAYNNIASSLDQLERHKEALTYREKALKVSLELFGEKSCRTAKCYGKLGFTLSHLGDKKGALEKYQKALELQLELLDNRDTDIAVTYLNMGSIFKENEEWEDALEYFYKALEIFLKAYGENHSSTAQSYFALAVAFRGLGDRDNALKLFKRGVAIQETVFGKNHPCLSRGYQIISDLLKEMGKMDEYAEVQGKLTRLEMVAFHGQDPWAKNYRFPIQRV